MVIFGSQLPLQRSDSPHFVLTQITSCLKMPDQDPCIIPAEIYENLKRKSYLAILKTVRKEFQHLSLFLDLLQKLTGSILG